MIPGPVTACHTISPAVADDDSMMRRASMARRTRMSMTRRLEEKRTRI